MICGVEVGDFTSVRKLITRRMMMLAATYESVCTHGICSGLHLHRHFALWYVDLDLNLNNYTQQFLLICLFIWL